MDYAIIPVPCHSAPHKMAPRAGEELEGSQRGLGERGEGVY